MSSTGPLADSGPRAGLAGAAEVARAAPGEAARAVDAALADLQRRVAALEGGVRGAGPGGAPSAPRVPGPAGDRVADVPDPDRFWALDALRTALGPHGGAVLFTGQVPLAGGGTALWQETRAADDLADLDVDDLAAGLSALASPVRLRLLRAVLRGVDGSGELSSRDEFGTTGQVHHHLRQLVAAGWLRQTTRGRYAVPVERVVPLLTVFAAASR